LFQRLLSILEPQPNFASKRFTAAPVNAGIRSYLKYGSATPMRGKSPTCRQQT